MLQYISHNIYRILLKIQSILKYYTRNHKTSRREHREELLDIYLAVIFFGCDTKGTGNKNKNIQVGFYQTSSEQRKLSRV